ncbi:alcohol dehydrogenase catalytic domain-containing protein [Undibacterium sp. Ji83W]|uniref:alcohol dehydrogenase catalytic domain-containing protein n=1 Tax=Undibacterium sp. Ji83W TaxID=3413043 RepID=UPI003BEF91B1
MKTVNTAAAISRFGDTSVIALIRQPRRPPRRGEIEVMVEATSVNPIDVRRRAGYGRKLFTLLGAAHFPLVLGNDFVGIVSAVGAGVLAFREGDAVFGAKPPSSTGSHATHIIVRADHAAHQPASMGNTPVRALAALPYNFTTVMRAFAGAGLNSENARGRDVLIHGASGRLGVLATRTLTAWGANVTAVCGTSGMDTCCNAGAVCVIDRYEQSLHDITHRFAATLNFANWEDETALLKLLASDAIGHATTVHPLLGNLDHGLLRGAIAIIRQKKYMRSHVPKGARYAWTVFAPDKHALHYLANNALMYTALTTCVDFPLAQAALAHSHVEQGRPGHAILLPTQS